MTLPSAFTKLADSYRDCENIARASNFYNGFRLLPRRKRQALSAVYAFMRQCDDISDDEGSAADKQEEFVRCRKLFDQVIRGNCYQHSTLPALYDTVRTFQIPAEYFIKLIDGTEMDLTTASYRSFEDLYRYCYHVASTVGLICIHIFGFHDSRAQECAEACGIAFQLTNILRDVKEDLKRHRIYLPLEDFQRFNYTESELRLELMDERFRDLMRFEAQRARTFYLKARPLVGMLERDSRPAFWAMFESYQCLLKNIERRNYDVLSRRVQLTLQNKFQILLWALTKW